jgi:mRNA-degrading endonuclease RelE of RelBE toxin-antitoxin system
VSLRIDWTPQAQRDLKRLDRPTSERIVAAVLRLAETNQGDVVKLAGKQPLNTGCASAAGGSASRGIKPPAS